MGPGYWLTGAYRAGGRGDSQAAARWALEGKLFPHPRQELGPCFCVRCRVSGALHVCRSNQEASLTTPLAPGRVDVRPRPGPTQLAALCLMSAYDMKISDAIYGKAARYVSRERVEEMLDHEFSLLRERLEESRGASTRFFAFADTAAAKAHAGGNDWHAWMGLRFQDQPGGAPTDVIFYGDLLGGDP